MIEDILESQEFLLVLLRGADESEQNESEQEILISRVIVHPETKKEVFLT